MARALIHHCPRVKRKINFIFNYFQNFMIVFSSCQTWWFLDIFNILGVVRPRILNISKKLHVITEENLAFLLWHFFNLKLLFSWISFWFRINHMLGRSKSSFWITWWSTAWCKRPPKSPREWIRPFIVSTDDFGERKNWSRSIITSVRPAKQNQRTDWHYTLRRDESKPSTKCSSSIIN